MQDAGNLESGFVPITPDRPLKEGDELVVAGRSQDIRQFSRELEERGADAGVGPVEKRT